MECRAYGDRGVLIHSLSELERFQLLGELEQSLPTGCSEHVLGYDSILLVDATLEIIQNWTKQIEEKTQPSKPKTRTHILPVIYDGADLAAVAKLCGLSTDTVIELHTTPLYTVRMMGFSPGFPYLDGLDARLHIDRRSSPRTRIEPGSVAIGGPHAGIYPVASPGGWHLLGRTDFTLFDLAAAGHESPVPEQIFALKVGDRVRFKPKVGDA